MEQQIRNILEDKNLNVKETEKALKELNIPAEELERILQSIHDEFSEKIYFNLYTFMKKNAQQEGKTAEEYLDEIEDLIKIRIKRLKKSITINYFCVSIILFIYLRGGYNTLFIKVIGISTLLLIAQQHYSSKKYIRQANEMAIEISELKQRLPKLRCIFNKKNQG